MKVFLTGASGFVGSHLTERLLNDGHEVFALIRNLSKFTIHHANLHAIIGDITAQEESWVNKLPEDLDAVIHTAGIVHSYKSQDFFNVNTLGTKKLVDILKKKYQRKLHFIFISCLAAAGPSKPMTAKNIPDEDCPVSDYGRSKKEAEILLLKNKGPFWKTIIIRPPMVIGPRDTAVLDIFKMVQDGIIILPGINSRNKEYSFVCVFDLIETIIASLTHQEDAHFYSANEQRITFLELILTIKEQMNKKHLLFLPLPQIVVKTAAYFLACLYKIKPHQLRLTPDKTHELFPNAWVCDASVTKEKLNQKFHYDLKETIRITFLDYKKSSLLK